MFKVAGGGTYCEHLWRFAGQASVNASKQTLHLCRCNRCPELRKLQLFGVKRRQATDMTPCTASLDAQPSSLALPRS